MFLKFLERFFNLNGHLVEVMVSITVHCNYNIDRKLSVFKLSRANAFSFSL